MTKQIEKSSPVCYYKYLGLETSKMSIHNMANYMNPGYFTLAAIDLKP